MKLHALSFYKLNTCLDKKNIFAAFTLFSSLLLVWSKISKDFSMVTILLSFLVFCGVSLVTLTHLEDTNLFYFKNKTILLVHNDLIQSRALKNLSSVMARGSPLRRSETKDWVIFQWYQSVPRPSQAFLQPTQQTDLC